MTSSNLALLKKPGTEPSGTPSWLASQMPAVYRSRYEEIERLSAEIQGMDRMGRLLYEEGAALKDVVNEAFAAFKSRPALSDDGACLMVRLDATRRVLVQVASADGPLERNSESVAGAFKLLQTTAGPGDRIVLVTTGQRNHPPQERVDTVSAEAQDLLRRMGVNVLPCTTLFNIWMLSLTALSEARACLELLHAQDGGTFKVKAAK